MVIGRGGFGKVWRVNSKRAHGDLKATQLAMKEMPKAICEAESVMNELRLLSTIESEFVVNMHYAFQNDRNLYLVMDLMPGGDLHYHR